MTINLKQYEKDSQLIWLVNNVQLPKGLSWQFEDRPWQVQIIEDRSKYIVVRKPTQVGLSTVFLGKMLYFADTNQVRCMYTLPRGDDVSDMVHSRLQEVITESPYVRERMGDIDNVRMKRFGKSWIHFSEMSVPPRMMDVDWMVNDEVDLSNQEHLEQAASRMDASAFGYRHQISTPSIEGYGIDALFKLSDQKHWVISCAYCSHEQILSWEDNVVNDEKNGTRYVCAKCTNNLYPDDIRDGRWVSMGNENSTLSGYQISHLMIPYINPQKLWIESKTMTPKNFYNFRLGLPYVPSAASLTKESVYSATLTESYQREQFSIDSSKYILGADQGNTITYSIGKITDNGSIKIVCLGEISMDSGFDELSKIAARFNIRFGVVDALPNHHSALKLAQQSGGRLSIAYFTNITDTYRMLDAEKININKTDAYDALVMAINNHKIKFYYNGANPDYWVDRAVTHITNMRRDTVQTMGQFGVKTVKNLWKNIGPDHFADAILYMYVAAEIAIGQNNSLLAIDLSDPSLVSGFAEDYSIYNDEFISIRQEAELLAERGFVYDESKESVTRIKNPGLVPDNPYVLLRSGGNQSFKDIIDPNKG
jgi:DNA-directed RNA polymerase subunit RPC12/RpoP